VLAGQATGGDLLTEGQGSGREARPAAVKLQTSVRCGRPRSAPSSPSLPAFEACPNAPPELPSLGRKGERETETLGYFFGSTGPVEEGPGGHVDPFDATHPRYACRRRRRACGAAVEKDQPARAASQRVLCGAHFWSTR
jgi:hypothetical protein